MQISFTSYDAFMNMSQLATGPTERAGRGVLNRCERSTESHDYSTLLVPF